MSNKIVLVPAFPGQNLNALIRETLIDNGNGTYSLFVSDIADPSNQTYPTDPANITVPNGAFPLVTGQPSGSPVNSAVLTDVVPSTILFTPTVAGCFKISTYLEITTVGVGGGQTLQPSFTWTDDVQGETASPFAALTALALGFAQGILFVRATNAQPIKYSTAYGGATTTKAQYRLFIRIEVT